MGWEHRKRGGQYYTRSRWIDGRVVRQYIGAGPQAEAIASLDAAERAERHAAAQAWAAERRAVEELNSIVEEADRAGDTAARMALMAAGYYRHHRGEWRKRRAR